MEELTEVQIKRILYEKERIERRKEIQKQIYNESNCLDKIKINIRSFFSWLLYK
jgi:hypothetical protein